MAYIYIQVLRRSDLAFSKGFRGCYIRCRKNETYLLSHTQSWLQRLLPSQNKLVASTFQAQKKDQAVHVHGI